MKLLEKLIDRGIVEFMVFMIVLACLFALVSCSEPVELTPTLPDRQAEVQDTTVVRCPPVLPKRLVP